MALKKIGDLNIAPIKEAIRRREMSLWVLPSVTNTEIRSLIGLPWINVWDASPKIDVSALWESIDESRQPLKIGRPDQDYDSFRVSEFVRIYNITKRESDSLRHKRFVDRLKDRVEESSGLLCFAGSVKEHWEEVEFVRELAPGLEIVILNANLPTLPAESAETYMWWDKDVKAFSVACKEMVGSVGDPEVVDLKDAQDVRLDRQLLEDVSRHWTFVSNAISTPPNAISQEEFDSFLNGDDSWAVYSMGAPYRRKEACKRIGVNKSKSTNVDFIDEVLKHAHALEHAQLEPTEQFEQILIFCESGSGITTLLRQTALELKAQGFPTLISRAFPRSFGGQSLENFIIDVQDRWLKNRKGRGSGVGLIPFCLLVDADGEATVGEQGLPRLLQALGRKVFLVRALERSQEEMEKANGVYALQSEVQEDEIVELGSHLRTFSERNGLLSIPGEQEWRAFHEGIASLNKFLPIQSANESLLTPPMFLIGLYPFIKERAMDENSLEQYYYRKWKDLGDDNARKTVRVLAAAGVYGLSVPFDTFRRHPDLDVLQLYSTDKKAKRAVDLFVGWGMQGHQTRGWFLHIRHVAIGLLLTRSIDPSEGDFPFESLLPLLKNLSTKEEDVWFAGTIAYRLGQHFRSRAATFSLEIDTAIQRAARAIFNGIPYSVKEVSRTIQHHQGRYHVHVLRACIDALKDPRRTVLTRNEIVRVARVEFHKATELLNLAAEVHGEGEPISNIFNTLATVHFSLVEMLEQIDSKERKGAFVEALNYEERAIKNDPSNGHALYQYIKRIIDSVSSFEGCVSEDELEMLSRAEVRLNELIELHEEKRWRNIDPLEAEKQLGSIVQDHVDTVKMLLGKTAHVLEFSARHPEAMIFLKIRSIAGKRSLREAFEDQESVEKLREQRTLLLNHSARSSRADSYLYRLFLEDNQGRLDFRTRLEVLQNLKEKDSEQFLPFKHDESTLHCQLDELDIGARKLAELRQFRTNNRTQWFWFNERALIEVKNGHAKPRKMTLQVIDPLGGWSRLLGTEIRVKYQTYQFGELERQDVFRAFIRFTLNGMQAVPETLIIRDMEDMRLS